MEVILNNTRYSAPLDQLICSTKDIELFGKLESFLKKNNGNYVVCFFSYDLKNHIEIINPKILVLLGSTALNTLIGNEMVISKARGRWIQKEIGSAKPWIIASFHLVTNLPHH